MYRYLTSKRLPRLLALSVFISTTFDLARALQTCESLGLCPLPNGLTGSGLENGSVDPWPPAKDTSTSEPCLPSGKDKISFKCNDGFRLQTTNIELFCDGVFNWNRKAPTCVEDVPTTIGLPAVTEAAQQLPPCAKCSDETLMMVIIILSVLLSISWLIIILIFICKKDALAVGNTRETVIVHGESRPTAPVVGHTIHEPVLVHSERRPMITQGSNINTFQLSERPPMPEPRTDPVHGEGRPMIAQGSNINTLQLSARPPMPEPRTDPMQRERNYDYVDRNKLKQNDYLELEK